ncbi:DNA-directed RNA polymerase specialized sigma subunit, sigma24 family [Verrucomicrobium sp. GAS474]|uniref:RNA polymerase sigma factor n=1 Tax=Verrucomicrobium sp. GAS474 TaxID=1882831 RepID=UPI00087C244F|nr:sigma-70 family RNA polymerase sigma factor [Verrucomicrobium sp. GAS474]SDU01410.1 DNA-directed RNA polymerase specialized sigma subunit, sigma24 family [Verrucomicrobium sp. GAS474]
MKSRDSFKASSPASGGAGTPSQSPSPKEAALVRAALLALTEKHGAIVLRYATRLAGDPKRGGEAVKRAFVLLAGLPDFPSLAAEKQVEKLYRAAREAALAQLKGEARRPRTATASPVDPVRLGLNQVQEEMLRLKFECGLGYPAIGAVLDVAPAHVARLVHAALAQVRGKEGAA